MSTRAKTIDTRLTSPQNNPCLKEHHLSLKCLDDNKYDHDLCTLYFENYKKCKQFWGDVMADRRRQRIEPILPPIEEREQIKQEYLTSLNASQK